jgi:transposase
MTLESFLEGHVRAFEWLGGVPRECVYDNLRSAVARRERSGDREVIHWNARFSQLRGHYAFHAHACTPETPREKCSVGGAVRYHKTGFWPARRFASLSELDDVYADWRDRVALPDTPRVGTSSPNGSGTSASSCGPCLRSASTPPCAGRRGSLPTAI